MPRIIPIIALTALALTFGGTWGCEDEDSSEDDPACTDEACASICLEQWDYDVPDWGVIDARCADDDTCQCDFSCDDDRCEAYCIDQEEATGGACAILSCECTYL